MARQSDFGRKPAKTDCFTKFASEISDFEKAMVYVIFPLTRSLSRHRIAPNMQAFSRYFFGYYFYGFRSPIAVGGA